MISFLRFPAVVTMIVLGALCTESHARNSATVTRVFNEVSILPPGATRIPAEPGAVVSGDTAVATGDDSRTELRFPDNTLTRLGANSVFRLDPASRSVELEQGVVLLQVPKQLGSGRVRTAAVTAAVSGTTLLVEYTPDNAIKIIVLEGEVNLYFNDRPSMFVTLKAGDMIIMKPDATSFPPTVQVDLDRLKKTSKLMNDDVFGPLGNQDEINNAIALQSVLQQKGELTKTSLMIEGIGTKVQIAQSTRDDSLALTNPGPPRPTPTPVPSTVPPTPTPAPQPTPQPAPQPTPPPLDVPLIASSVLVDADTVITTNPTIQVIDADTEQIITGQGAIYDPLTQGPLYPAMGADAESDGTASLFQSQGKWSVFQFNDIRIYGTPEINSSTGPRNLMLVSRSHLTMENDLESELPITLNIGPELDALALISLNGEALFSFESRIQGGSQLLLIEASGSGSDLIMQQNPYYFDEEYGDFKGGDFFSEDSEEFESRDIFLDGGHAVFRAGRDLLMTNKSVEAAQIDLTAGRDFLADGAVLDASDSISISAENNVNIENTYIVVDSTSEIWALSQATPEEIKIVAQTGNVTVSASTIDADNVRIEAMLGNIDINDGSLILADTIKAMTHSANGAIILNNSTLEAGSLIRLYAEGSNGMIHFTGNTNFYGGGRVDLAGKTVRVDSGVNVTVDNPSQLHVFTDNPEYSNSGATGFGNLQDTNQQPIQVNRQDFNQRPPF